MKKIYGRNKLAKMFGVSTNTIRWLEEKGKVHPKTVIIGGIAKKEYNAKDITFIGSYTSVKH